VKHSLADIALAEKTIGFKPRVSFQEGLAEAIDWYRKNLL
jgi:UDP-N-acetylglucosamine 4-epimerase